MRIIHKKFQKRIPPSIETRRFLPDISVGMFIRALVKLCVTRIAVFMNYSHFRHGTQIRKLIVPSLSESGPVTFIQKTGQIGKTLERLETYTVRRLVFIFSRPKNSKIMPRLILPLEVEPP